MICQDWIEMAKKGAREDVFDANPTKRKDGRTHLAHRVEHAGDKNDEAARTSV